MKKDLAGYWRTNIRYMVILMCIWALVSYVLGVIFVTPLNTIHIAGYPLGFWIGNQGSEVVFVVLIFVYCALMNKLDRKYDVHE